MDVCRMLFYLSLVVLLATITCVQGAKSKTSDCPAKFKAIHKHTACLKKSPNAKSWELTDKFKKILLDGHNDMRSRAYPTPTSMLKMTWDDEVEMLAKKWVETCDSGILKDGQLFQDEEQHRYIPARFSVGQNLDVAKANFSKVFQDWYTEGNDYIYGLPISFTKIPVSHYTQIVWAESYKLGCAEANCSGTMVYACNYGPAGNVPNFREPYRSGSMTLCNITRMDKNLCDCGNMECPNGSPLDPKHCKCACQPEYFLDKSCKFNCSIPDSTECGKEMFQAKDCTGPAAVKATQKCPHMCHICTGETLTIGSGSRPASNSANNFANDEGPNLDRMKSANSTGSGAGCVAGSTCVVSPLALCLAVLHSIKIILLHR